MENLSNVKSKNHGTYHGVHPNFYYYDKLRVQVNHQINLSKIYTPTNKYIHNSQQQETKLKKAHKTRRISEVYFSQTVALMHNPTVQIKALDVPNTLSKNQLNRTPFAPRSDLLIVAGLLPTAENPDTTRNKFLDCYLLQNPGQHPK